MMANVDERLPVSVAICTRDRPECLRRALRSVAGQKPPVAEIIVVDNGSDPESLEPLIGEEFPGCRYVIETRQGLDFARNAALRAASQAVVAFLDDDAVAAPDWAARIAAPLLIDPGVSICTGRVEALNPDAPGARMFEASGGFCRLVEGLRLPEDRATRRIHGRKVPLIVWSISAGVGCSMAVRRETALAIGGFDEALDLGPVLPGGGDFDLFYRLMASGHGLVHETQALAWHEHRHSVDGVADQVVGHHRALIAFLTKSAVDSTGIRRAEAACFLVWRLLKPGVRLVRRVSGRDPLPASIILRMWWNCFSGLAAYGSTQRVAKGRNESSAA
jgi:glycosyltransferase involved in cell wall biosynthesis